MLQNPRKTLGFKKNMVYKIPPGGEVNHIQPVAYRQGFWILGLNSLSIVSLLIWKMQDPKQKFSKLIA